MGEPRVSFKVYTYNGRSKSYDLKWILHWHTKFPVLSCAAVSLNLLNILVHKIKLLSRQSNHHEGLTCFRWFLRIVPSGSGRFGRSSTKPDGGVILFESRSISQMSSGSLTMTCKRKCMIKETAYRKTF
jgi:hypothetical protein